MIHNVCFWVFATVTIMVDTYNGVLGTGMYRVVRKVAASADMRLFEVNVLSRRICNDEIPAELRLLPRRNQAQWC